MCVHPYERLCLALGDYITGKNERLAPRTERLCRGNVIY